MDIADERERLWARWEGEGCPRRHPAMGNESDNKAAHDTKGEERLVGHNDAVFRGDILQVETNDESSTYL